MIFSILKTIVPYYPQKGKLKIRDVRGKGGGQKTCLRQSLRKRLLASYKGISWEYILKPWTFKTTPLWQISGRNIYNKLISGQTIGSLWNSAPHDI